MITSFPLARLHHRKRTLAIAVALVSATFLLPATPASASVVVDTTFSGNGFDREPMGFDYWSSVATLGNSSVVAGSKGQNDLIVTKYNRRGRLDASFSQDGKRTFVLESPRTVHVEIDSQNRILIFARSLVGFEIIRLTETGALDESFGGSGGKGRVQFVVGGNGTVAYTLDGLDRPVLLKGTNSSVQIWRRTVDGNADDTFSDDGTLNDTARSGRFLGGVDTTSSNEIVVFHAGYYTDNLDLDLTKFSSDGSTIDSVQTVTRKGLYPADVAVDTDDSIMAVAAGPEVGSRVLAIRVNAAGDLDTSFAGDGTLSGPCDERCNVWDITVDDTGATYLTGASFRGPSSGIPTYDAYVGRITAAGQWDESFASGGIRTLSLFHEDNDASAIDLDAQGRVLIAGGVGDNKRDGFIARLLVQ